MTKTSIFGEFRLLCKMEEIFFCTASELIESDKLHLFLLSGGTPDDDEYLESYCLQRVTDV